MPLWKLDRVGRSIADLIHLLALFEDRGIEFHSLTDVIVTTTAGGSPVFHIMGAPGMNVVRQGLCTDLN